MSWPILFQNRTMPELPEVEVTRLGLLSSLPGCRVTHVAWSDKRLRLPIPRKLLARHILNNTIITIDRRAKYLLFRMADKAVLVIHLGMTGKLALLPPKEPCARHDHLRLQLDTRMELRFNDARRFGSVTVWPPTEAKQLEKSFSERTGVEPFDKGFNAACLLDKSSSTRQPVKNFLMDSRKVAGLGNIYANEILFAARIHPLTPSCSITRDTWRKIITATRRILNQAIKAGGSTISDFLGTGGNPGYFQFQFKVYRHQGKDCQRCRTPIVKTVIAGRATYFCPVCQPQPESPGPEHPAG